MTVLLLLCSTFLSCLAISPISAFVLPSSPSTLFVKESTSIPHGWSLDTKKPVSPTETVRLSIGLVQTNPSGLEEALTRISDPASPTYGNFLTRDAVLGFLAPNNGTTAAVNSWLSLHDISTHPSSSFAVSSTQDWYTVVVTVATADKLLSTTFRAYSNADTSERILRALSYSLPNSLASSIDTIQPTTFFSSGSKASRSTKNTSVNRRSTWQPNDAGSAGLNPSQFPNCTKSDSSVVPPWCVKKIYNVGTYAPDPAKAKGNTIAIAGYLENYAQYSDLKKYLKLYDPKALAAGYTFESVSLSGKLPPQTDDGADTEANIDVQMVAGLAYPIPMTYYAVGGSGSYAPDENTESNTNEPYLSLQNYLLSLSDAEIPSVLTTSYGDDEQTVSKEYAVRVCRGYAALGARGVSVIFSSGDIGVGPVFGGSGKPDDVCLTNDGTKRTVFIPSFPATCPWVTTVGEVQSLDPEVGIEESSGGFSTYFDRPSYQDTDVKSYLDWWGTKYSSYFNRNGRAFPDVSAQGSRVPIYDDGEFNLGFGTSVSAPIVASLVALLNDHRLQNGLPKLGFLNPLLYSSKAKSAFNDVTKGNIPGCGTNGFAATKGWDPVSGLGTPNFGELKDITSG